MEKKLVQSVQKTEAVVKRCAVKPMFPEISQNSLEACNFIKNETLAQLFPCEFCEISKNTFFHRTPLMPASDKAVVRKRSSK